MELLPFLRMVYFIKIWSKTGKRVSVVFYLGVLGFKFKFDVRTKHLFNLNNQEMKFYVTTLLLFLGIGQAFSQTSEKKVYNLPKGSYLISPTFSLSQKNGTDNTVLGVKIDDQYELEYSVNTNTAYFISDDFSIGLQLGYSNNQRNITYYPSGSKTTLESYTNLVSLVPNIRNYFGKGIFKGFTQTNLGFAFGKGLERSYAEANDTKTDTRQYMLTLAVQPGVAIFVADFVSVELSINLIGLTSKLETSTLNDGTESRLYSNKVDFDINILSVNIGIGFYIKTGNKLNSK
jgi:hypothetical protein